MLHNNKVKILKILKFVTLRIFQANANSFMRTNSLSLYIMKISINKLKIRRSFLILDALL